MKGRQMELLFKGKEDKMTIKEREREREREDPFPNEP